MEKSFDFGALLQNHEKKHKNKPTQFVSVAGGVRKRLESNIKSRKSSRLTNFDSIRDLPKYESPLKESDPLTKAEHRRIQLEKWKEEKQKKKKEAAAHKKKPFLTGVAHAPMTFVPPPPVPKAVPSSSGRVTRSQSAKINSNKPKPSKSTIQQIKTESFAPKNAVFKAPEIKNMAKLPTLVPLSKIKKTKETIMFDPVVPPVVRVNSRTKLNKIQNKNMHKVTSQVEQRTLRGPGRFVKVASSSSSQSHSSGERLSPPQQSKSRVKTAHVKSSSEEMSPVSERPKPKKKTSRKSVQSSEDMLSPAKQSLHKSRTPRKPMMSNITSTPKNPIPKSESSSEERLRSPKSPVNVPLTPEQIVEEAKRNSPFVTLSRGKDNARKETMKKINDGLFDEDASDADSVDHFRRQLDSEIKRMTEMCETWEKISEQVVLPETVQEAVLGAVGQARLLMSHKLQQFAALLARCERPEPGQPLVTPADLHGFWDMVFMQVVNLDVRFKKLEEMRARNWAEEAPVAPRRRAAPRAKPAARPAAASRLRDLIAAARKAQKQEKPESSVDTAAEAQGEPDKTFEAGFFCVRSPVRSPATPARVSRPSLLKAVLSSEAKKSATKNIASLAMLRASLIGKNVENDSPLVKPQIPLTPINLHATPGRSILKPLNVPSAKKSIKVVLFDDSDAGKHDTSCKNEEHDSNMSGVEKLEDGTPDTGISSSVEPEKEKENRPRNKPLIRQDAVDDSQMSPIMTRSRRKSLATTEDNENKTPKHTSRRKKALQEVEVNVPEENNFTPRRSSRRKSVVQDAVA